MSSEGGSALRVVAAEKRFGAVRALDGLSFEVGRREWVGLLGPNGAGKSTLMRSIVGLTELDAGRVEMANGSGQESVGFVPQEIALYPLLSAEENLRIFGRLHGLGRRALGPRVQWALEWTGLGDRAREPIVGFSGGMQRRLNIACGVLHEPKLVLLDEPTVGVDPQGRQRIWGMLEELRRGGATLVHSSHELHEVESTCDRVLIVDRGQLVASGTVDELVTKTLGAGAELRLTLDREAREGPVFRRFRDAGFEITNATLRGELADVASNLPPILDQLRTAGYGVVGVHVERPDLAAVFTRLTGRELRE